MVANIKEAVTLFYSIVHLFFLGIKAITVDDLTSWDPFYSSYYLG